MTALDVPTRLTRSRLTALVSSLGIDPADAVELHITPDRVELVVLAKNDRGVPFATHTIAMEVVEGE